MQCTSPLSAYQVGSGEVVFFARKGMDVRRELKLPCGQCVRCRLERSRQWAVRCVHETQMHEHSVFLTLTYDDDHLPGDWSLRYSDFQKFCKRLRYKKGPFRFYMCGEYGEENKRPHFHALIFGHFFADRYPWRLSGAGFQLYRSAELEDLWTLGSVEIGDVTFESAAYVARYCVSALTNVGKEWILDPDTGELYERVREFTRMSLKPGIGATWFSKFRSDVYPCDEVVVRGVRMRPPRYYDQLLKNDSTFMSDDIEYDRYKRSLQFRVDGTPERLAVINQVTGARLKFKKRSL